MKEDLPILYVKKGCPWCSEAISFLDGYGVEYRLQDVASDAAAFDEMKRKSGQSKTPTLDWHGEVLADFGVDELKPFLKERNVQFEDS